MTLPPGFRFHPTDVELVGYYLKKRVKGIAIEFDVIADVDLYKCEPWDLPPKSRLPSNDLEWFFFSPRDRKYPNGSRTNRATETGYWKATGRDRYVKSAGANSKTIGMKKTLVFYMGRAPHGERTDWLMHEYRLDGDEWEATNVSQDAYVLCRVFKKNGLGPPKNPSGNSIDDGVDNADSPGDEKSSVSFENDVKPSLDLHTQMPLITARLPGQAEGVLTVKQQHVDEYSSEVPVSNMDSFGPDLVFDDSFLTKMDLSNWDFSWLEPNNDAQLALVPTYPDSTVDVKNEFKNPWQGQVGGDLWREENSRNNMLPIVENDYLGGLDMLPSLVTPESPSPPTLQSSCTPSSPYPCEPDSFIETPQPIIRIRPRLPHASQFRSPMAGAARQLVKFQKPPRSVAQDKQRGVSETETCRTSGPAEIESKHENGAKDVILEASKVPSGKQDDEEDLDAKISVLELPSKNASSQASKASSGPESDGEIGEPNSRTATVTRSPTIGTAGSDQNENISLASSPQVTVGPETLSQEPHDADSEVGPGALLQKPQGDDYQTLTSELPIFRLGSVCFQPARAAEYSSAEPLKNSKLEGVVEFPSKIGSIRVNAVTITCSCDKVGSQAHVQTTVCDCYNSNSKSSNDRVLPGSWNKAPEQNHKEGKSLERRKGVSTRGFACAFVMGTLSACFGFFVMHEIWRATRQVVRNGVHIVSAASDL